MKKPILILSLLTLGMIGGTAAFLYQARGNLTLGKPGVVLGDVPLYDEMTNQVAATTVILPKWIPGYESSAMPISKMELDGLPKDTTFGKRRYGTLHGTYIDLNVVLMGQDRTSLHKPQFCLVGQGWAIEKTEVISLKMKSPYPYEMPVMKLTASTRIKDKEGNQMTVRAYYIYWFVADNKLAADHAERVWSMAVNLLKTGVLERWAYISYFCPFLPGQEDETFDRLTKFISSSAPEFQIPAGSRVNPANDEKLQTASN